MKLRPNPSLTFDDVLLVPRRSAVRSRSEVSTATRLSRNIAMNIPIVSANMDTVTGSLTKGRCLRHNHTGKIHNRITTSTGCDGGK